MIGGLPRFDDMPRCQDRAGSWRLKSCAELCALAPETHCLSRERVRSLVDAWTQYDFPNAKRKGRKARV